MEFHEIANIFPMMTGDAYRSLRDDINKNGLLDPITVYEGKILDGRNRYVACMDLGIAPSFAEYVGGNPVDFVVSKNLNRRHLDESQRAGVSDKLTGLQRGGNGSNQYESKSANLRNSITQEEAAKIMNISPRLLQTYKQIKREAPEFLKDIDEGNLTVNKAWTKARRKKAIKDLEDIEKKEAKAIEGVYDTIVIDPPWPIQKIEREERPNQAVLDYPTMTIEELENLQIPSADDCHIWVWTTQKYLPSALYLLGNWGFSYVCTFVWHKPGGFQPFNLPQYNCEFVLYAHKGSPKFVDLKNFNTCFNAPRGEHSEKPDEFYDMVRRVTAGRRLDMFGRRKINGFDSWGKEA